MPTRQVVDRSLEAPPTADRAPRTAALVWSEGWTLVQRDGGLLITAGADRSLLVDGHRSDVLDTVRAWAEGEPVVFDESEPSLQAIGSQLVAAGALRPVIGPAIAIVGEPPAGFSDALGRLGVRPSSSSSSGSDGDGQLALVVRSDARWPDIGATDVVHLGVDLSNHHTIVLGPLVVPGVTSCLDCLDAQVLRRWEPMPTAPEPRASVASAVAAQLVEVQLRLALAGRSPLVNATTSWNLETGTTRTEGLMRHLGCQRCSCAPAPGKVVLPWEST